MNDESRPDDVEDPKPDLDEQALAGTGNEEQDDLDTAREMATIVPSTPEQLDSATIPGVELRQERIVLEADVVPGYDLLGELGRGGMGVVYKARDQKLKRIVALKMILSGAHASDEDMQRFQIEAEAVAKLQHPNIVQIFEVSEHEGRPYIALEFADGGSLDQKIAGVPQNASESAELIETLARAMQQAHDNDIIHRDLKPANILLTADGDPRITDFGLAKRMDEDSSQTKSGAVMGTPSYMAPEQAASTSSTLGPAADTYALGAILYHMLTGRPPFQAETQLDTIMQVIGEEPIAPRRLNSTVPVDLETICLKCLEKDVHRRYESAEALAEDLRRFGANEPIQARPVSVITRGIKWARRRPAIAGMISISVAALVALVAGGLWYNAQLQDSLVVAENRRKEAQQQRELAETREQEAEQARLETRRRMAYANVVNGRQLAEQGNLSGSLVWFTEALRLDQGIPEREQIHRQRLAQAMAGCARPRHVWIHNTPLLSLVRFSPDFQKVVTADPSGGIYLWDMETGDLVGEPLENEGPVIDVAFDNTGNRLAAAVLLLYDFDGGEPNSITRIWDLTTGKRLKEKFKQARGTEQVSFHPSKNRLMTASTDGKVILWNAETGEVVNDKIHHPRDRVDDFDFHRNQFNPDGSLLLTASDDGTVRLWDTETGDPMSQPLVHSGAVRRARFSPDGKRVLTASSDETARVWDVETGMPVTRPLVHKDDVLEAIFSPDGRRVATLSENWNARVWDARSGQPLTGYLEHDEQVNVIDFSPEGQFVVTGSDDGTVRLWSVGSGRLQEPLLYQPGKIQFVKFHPDGRHLITGSQSLSRSDGAEARIWDLSANTTSPLLLESATARHVRFVPGSTRILVAGDDNSLRLYDAKTGDPIADGVNVSGDIIHFEFDNSGTRLVTATSAGVVRVRDTVSLQPLTAQMNHQGSVENVHFSVDGSRLVTTTREETVHLWDAVTGKPLGEPIETSYDVDAVFRPDGQLAIFNSTSSFGFDPNLVPLQTWKVDRQGELTPGTLSLETRKKGLNYKAVKYGFFSPRLLAIVTQPAQDQMSEHSLYVFDARTGSRNYEIVFGEGISGASFNTDGTRLLVYTPSKARVLDAVTGQPVSLWMQTGGVIKHAVFSPDGLLVATADTTVDNSGTARVWDAQTGQPVTSPLVHADPVVALDFSSDSSQLLTRSGEVRIWNIQPSGAALEQLVATAQFLSTVRLDETAALQSLNPTEQRDTWAAFKTNGVIERTATARQVQTWREGLYSLARADRDVLAMRRHQDLLMENNSNEDLLWARSLTATSLGDIATALKDLQELMVLVPDDQCFFSANYVMLLLHSGDQEGYRRECTKLLNRYENTTNPMIAERVAKTCYLDAVDFPDGDIRMQLAERAVGAGKQQNKFHAYAQLAHGMACYRAGQYADALRQLEPLGDMTRPPTNTFQLNGKILAMFFVAMSQHRLGKQDLAEHTLEIAINANHARGEIEATYGGIYDWLRCDIIESEATRLLHGLPGAPANTE